MKFRGNPPGGRICSVLSDGRTLLG